MSKLSEKQLLILTIAVSVLFSGGLVALVLSDRGEIEQIESEIETIDQRIAAADVEIRKIPRREEEVLIFRAVEEDELEILPSKQHIADFQRNLSTFFQQAGLRFRELPESSPTPSELASGIFVTRLNLSCIGDADAILKFMNMVENDERLIAIKGFNIAGGQKIREDETKAIEHEVELALATYFYDPQKVGVNRVPIPGEARRLQDPKLREMIAAFQPERPDTYLLRPSLSRRDAFVDPRVGKPEEDTVAPDDYDRQAGIVAELEGRHREIVEKLAMEAAYRADGRIFEEDQIRRLIDEKVTELEGMIAKVKELKEVSIPELLARISVMEGHLSKEVHSRPDRRTTITADIAEGFHATILKKFQDNEYAEVSKEYAAWSNFELGKDKQPSATIWLERIKELASRAKDLGDFYGEGIRVTGVIVVNQDPRRSVAMINGGKLTVREGDRLKDGGEITVYRIERQQVTFRFRGELIRVPVRGVERQPAKEKGRHTRAASHRGG